MHQELQRHKKKDTIKWVAIFLIAILLIAAVCALFAKVYNAACWFEHDYGDDGICVRCGAEKPIDEDKPTDDNEQDADVDGGMEMDEGNVVEHGISLMSVNIPRALYSEYDIAPIAETAQQLTATIIPSYADNLLVDWSVEWKNPSSTFATGKSVTSYVTVTPTSNGALTANVACLQAFGEQIIVKCTSRDDSEKYATCAVDYVQKFTGLVFNMPDIASETTSFTYQVETSVYTIKSDISLSASDMSLTSGLIAKIKEFYNANVEYQNDFPWSYPSATVNISNSNITISSSSRYGWRFPINNVIFANFIVVEDNSWGDWLVSEKTNEGDLIKGVRNALDSVSGAHATFDITYKATYKGVTYSTGTKTVDVRFDGSSMRIPITGVSLNSDNVLF